MNLRTAVLGAVALVAVAGSCADDDVHARREASSSAGSATSAGSAGSATSATSVSTPPPLPAGDDTTVTRVVDGDTLVVERAGPGGSTRVRLIGIDTPETKDPRTSVQCFGREAAARTALLVQPGTPVRLVADVEPEDRYGRGLAYVYRRADGLFVNAALVRDGYASAYTYPPNVAHAQEFVSLQREAREAGRGLWAACEQPPRAPSSGSTAPAGTACEPAYPDVCIPPSPPDLDCADVAARRFRVLAPDPHRFDGRGDEIGDGVGCEGP